jgi:hypothetical protein
MMAACKPCDIAPDRSFAGDSIAVVRLVVAVECSKLRRADEVSQ